MNSKLYGNQYKVPDSILKNINAQLYKYPDSEGIKRAKNIFGNNISKKNTWIIGDSIYDIRCAKVNGLRCLAVCTGLTSRIELENEEPDYIVDDFSNLDDILNILTK